MLCRELCLMHRWEQRNSLWHSRGLGCAYLHRLSIKYCLPLYLLCQVVLLLIVFELDHAPDVPIELSLLILQEGMFLLAALLHL